MAPRTGNGTTHLDVLIVGAGLSGVGAGHYLQDTVPVGQLRHLRSPRHHRWHLGPLPVSGHPLRLGHAHPGLLVPALGRARSPSRTATPSSSTSRTPPPSPASTPGIRFNHRIIAADWSTDDAVWHVTAERTDTGETVQRHRRLPVLLHRLLPLRPRLPARVRGHGGLRGNARAPAGLARGPRRRREAHRRHRQRRDGRDPRARRSPLGGPRDHAAALAHLHRLAARTRARSPGCCASACRPGRPVRPPSGPTPSPPTPSMS